MRQIGMFLKQYRAFYILTLVVLNMAYISIEIYKSKIVEPLLGKSNITKLEFSKIETLSNFAYYFEVSFLIVSIIWTLLLFSKKYKPQFKKSIIIQLSFLILVFIFNYTLSWIFGAPVGNLTQLLLGPLVFVIGAIIYFTLSSHFSSKRRYKRKNVVLNV